MEIDTLFTHNYKQRLAKGKGGAAKENAFTCLTFFDRNYSCRVRSSVRKMKKNDPLHFLCLKNLPINPLFQQLFMHLHSYLQQ